MQSTIALFREMYHRLPPLFPVEIKKKMEHALHHLEGDQTVSLEEIENLMIDFGYQVWPWKEAYREFLAFAENKVGEHFLLPKLSHSTVLRYENFKHYGGSLRDLHSGRPADFFTPEERNQLCVALVEIQKELHDFTDREILGTEKEKYLQRVKEFTTILKEISQSLENLRIIAKNEEDHPRLADEIRAKIKYFEYSLCLLGPELDYGAVCNSLDFFKGRKEELSRLSNIAI